MNNHIMPFQGLQPLDLLRIDQQPWIVYSVEDNDHMVLWSAIDGGKHTISFDGVMYNSERNDCFS